MDVDVDRININGGDDSVLAPKDAVGSVTIAYLHPLVIMNISDQWTRQMVQSGATPDTGTEQLQCPEQVFGALIGTREGRRLEIMNSYELVMSSNTNEQQNLFDLDYFVLKEEQYKQVFQKMEILGWYRTGKNEDATKQDVATHEQFCLLNKNENSVFLKMTPLLNTSELPIKIFESVLDLVPGGTTKLLFISLPSKILTEDAERIGIEHITRASSGSGDDSSSMVAQHLVQQHAAVKSLFSRVQLILAYVKAVERREISYNAEVMRCIAKICKHLPAINPERLDQSFISSFNDGILITYLGVITKGCEQLKQLMVATKTTQQLVQGEDGGDRGRFMKRRGAGADNISRKRDTGGELVHARDKYLEWSQGNNGNNGTYVHGLDQ